MNTANHNTVHLRDELVARVAALDGKQAIIDGNQKTLAATVEALAECTNVDLATIQSIADRLSVQPQFVDEGRAPTDQEARLAKNTQRAKVIAIVAVALFTFSLLKWMNINGSIKDVMHQVSAVQSRTSDFHLRTGRFPHEFKAIGYTDGVPAFESVKKIEMGPQGQLLINTKGLFSSQILLTPLAMPGGLSKWRCTTNSSWLFKVSSWLCGYQSSLQFSHQ